MKDKNNIFEENPQGMGIILGLLACTGIEVYDHYADDIARKAAEVYNKVQPVIQPYIESLSNVDPYHIQLGTSAIAVSILSATLVHLRKKDMEEQKVNREFVKCNYALRNIGGLTTVNHCATRDISRYATTANYAYRNAFATRDSSVVKVKKIK